MQCYALMIMTISISLAAALPVWQQRELLPHSCSRSRLRHNNFNRIKIGTPRSNVSLHRRLPLHDYSTTKEYDGGVMSHSSSQVRNESKDEVIQAQTQTSAELSSLESALNSAVHSLESMSRQLEICMTQLEKELESTRLTLVSARSELDSTRTKLRTMNKRLSRSSKRINVTLESDESGPYLISASVEVKSSPGVEMLQSQQPQCSFCTRSSIMFPDLSGKTVGNG
jgi:hypothetical protein